MWTVIFILFLKLILELRLFYGALLVIDICSCEALFETENFTDSILKFEHKLQIYLQK